MNERIAGIDIPDSRLAREATELVRDAASPLLFHHSRRVFLFGSLQGNRLGLPEDRIRLAWLGIALHTTPETPYHMEPEVALVTAGVETDVLGIGYADLDRTLIDAVLSAHPRPDFKRQILQAFTEGMKDRPATTFGTVNADVLAHFVPGFVRGDFVRVIEDSDWPE
jgi:hypothetical protein